jgi:hypothetical protein
MSEVLEQGFTPLLLIDRQSDVAVEIAIGAFRDAEGPVNVERQLVIPAKAGIQLLFFRIRQKAAGFPRSRE